MNRPCEHEPIAAPATPTGGALAVVRLSGEGAIACCDRIFQGRGPLCDAPAGSVRFGTIRDGERMVDEVLVTLFRAPHSYTGEQMVEISCHGSAYIVSEILRLLARHGARPAQAGEFTSRAFLAGRLDLAQAEAVADLIACDTRAAHALATNQMRGGYSAALATLREELVKLTSLLELELDFSEEDVQFADRATLRQTMHRLDVEIRRLAESFALGNVLKEGIPVAIVGAPNAGKSTLLNRLLGDERALVSEIAGTTRDTIEERLTIDGVLFRFIDTAGLRETGDRLEQMGIRRTWAALEGAKIILHLLDATAPVPEPLPVASGQTYLPVLNKTDLLDPIPTAEAEPISGEQSQSDHPAPDRSGQIDPARYNTESISTKPGRNVRPTVGISDPLSLLPPEILAISAKRGTGIDALRSRLRSCIDTSAVYHGDAVVSNRRHHEALVRAGEALARALAALDDGTPTDLLGEELRQVNYHLGTITGTITSDEILGSIFSKFCIGK